MKKFPFECFDEDENIGLIAIGRSLRKFRESHGSIGQIPSGYVSRREALHGNR
ncbi:hypothetical protein ALC60_08489 [Trachymyrmex zeteki]|uniref:Uncharacterized protein n=1 Tax=Mycetomoellerius zeteki TaxID=64791 RepID=A0A151WWW6_9HYME|nr:hypothetical protein ALC60_08489 [Trachymyrmex zeteki]